MTKPLIMRALAFAGAKMRKPPAPINPVEFSGTDLEVLNYVIDNGLTMASRERVIATINACKHAVEARIDGDFVECGVWRGGCCIAAKLTFENYRSDKKVWLFDTFAGMTPPSDLDTTNFSSGATAERFKKNQSPVGYNNWCFAPLDEVKSNLERSGADLSGVRFVVGDVVTTLANRENIPPKISVLRLDTDFYDSTKAELETLYPRLAVGGSLLIDDFGHWDGARRAVEEYFGALPPRDRPLFHLTDYTGRMGVKVHDGVAKG
jgi:hypothetical protein